MTRFEIRTCDYCERETTAPLPPERHEKAGWTTDGGLDICPVCAFTEDTGPSPEAIKQIMERTDVATVEDMIDALSKAAFTPASACKEPDA